MAAALADPGRPMPNAALATLPTPALILDGKPGELAYWPRFRGW